MRCLIRICVCCVFLKENIYIGASALAGMNETQLASEARGLKRLLITGDVLEVYSGRLKSSLAKQGGTTDKRPRKHFRIARQQDGSWRDAVR